MLKTVLKLSLLSLIMTALLWSVTHGGARNAPRTGVAEAAETGATGPQYSIHADIDYQLLTFKSQAKITVPARANDPLRDVVFFLYANAMSDGDRPFIVVDDVTLNGQKVKHQLKEAVLRVELPQEQRAAFQLTVNYRGVVPRAPAGSGGLMDAMGSFGGLGGDISGLLGGLGGAGLEEGTKQPAPTAPQKPADYGLYTYGDGVLSLGSFWYPSLAVRKEGKWMDEAPSGLGDVGYAEASDFRVVLDVPKGVTVAASGTDATNVYGSRSADAAREYRLFIAGNVRDFAVLMSEGFAVKSRTLEAGGRQVTVSAYTTKQHAAKADQVLDIAAGSLQAYAKRFGPYPYPEFKVVEGPIRGGAGGMEYSGMTAIASMLYDDWGKQIQALTSSLGMGNLDKLMGALELDDGAAAANPATEWVGGMFAQQKAMFDSLLEMTIAHEAAHQWWAMGVGSDAQREPWVDESLTNYTAILYFEDRYGPQKAAEMIDLHLKTPYSMGRMLGGGDARVDMKTTAYSNNIQYGAIVYGKGALFYDALRRLVGEEAFFGALREYYAQYQGRLAEGNALQTIMKSKAPGKAQQIDALYRRWIKETHGDEDITGGQATGLGDILGGLFGGMGDMMEQ